MPNLNDSGTVTNEAFYEYDQDEATVVAVEWNGVDEVFSVQVNRPQEASEPSQQIELTLLEAMALFAAIGRNLLPRTRP
jgi:hypothetical protein